ncbi:MAG: ferredoxin--NADP reductase [Hyphomicrobiales bacterium]
MENTKQERYIDTIERNGHFLESIREINSSAYVLRFSKNNLNYKSGQYITLGLENDLESREYSVYSGANEDFLEVLVREVEDGNVSKKLKKIKKNQELNVDGPFGFFTIPEEEIKSKKLLFIATGTGISPFHSHIKTHKGMDYTILHGVSSTEDCFDKEVYEKDRYISCISKSKDGDFFGRVTDYLRQHPIDPNTRCYLCGNCNMIYEAFDILSEKGIPSTNLHAEVYF